MFQYPPPQSDLKPGTLGRKPGSWAFTVNYYCQRGIACLEDMDGTDRIGLAVV